MRCIVVLLASLLVLPGSAFAQKSVTEKVPLRFVKPSQVVQFLTQPPAATISNGSTTRTVPTGEEPPLPPGVERLTPNDRAMTLTVRGTNQAVSQVKEMVRLLDVQPRTAGLQVRVVRVQVSADGKVQELPGIPLAVQAVNNTPSTALVTAERNRFQVVVTPRINGDDSVSLQMQLNLLGLNNKVVASANRLRRVKPGESVRLVGVTTETRVQEAVREGEVPTNLGVAFTAYLLEVSVAEGTNKADAATR